jgi:LysM repeat protein
LLDARWQLWYDGVNRRSLNLRLLRHQTANSCCTKQLRRHPVKKQSLLSVSLIVLAIALLASTMAACARPKPDAKLTPTATSMSAGAATTPLPAATQPSVEPTVVITNPSTVVAPATAVPAEGEEETEGTTAPAADAGAGEATTAASGGDAESTLYTVQWGDTLFSIASKHNTSVEEIAALNGISRPDQIQTGMQIKIPGAGSGTAATDTTTVEEPASTDGSEYVVKPGDDLYAISQKFGVSVDDLVKANDLSTADFIFVGQTLTIPGAGGAAVEATPADSSAGKTHTVKAGETLATIASQYGVTANAIADANGIKNPNVISVGQVLKIP